MSFSAIFRNSRSPFPHLCTKKVVPHLLHLQQGRVTISPLPHTISPFKSPYHGRAENDTFQSSVIKTPLNVTSIVMLFNGSQSKSSVRLVIQSGTVLPVTAEDTRYKLNVKHPIMSR